MSNWSVGGLAASCGGLWREWWSAESSNYDLVSSVAVVDELMRKAQEEAAARGKSLQAFLTENISSKLMPEGGGSKPSVMSYAGIFRDSREESARIMETIKTAAKAFAADNTLDCC